MWKHVCIALFALTFLTGQTSIRGEVEEVYKAWKVICGTADGHKARVVAAGAKAGIDIWALLVVKPVSEDTLEMWLETTPRIQTVPGEKLLVRALLDSAKVTPIAVSCRPAACTSIRLRPKSEGILARKRLTVILPTGRATDEKITFELDGLSEALQDLAHRNRKEMVCTPRA